MNRRDFIKSSTFLPAAAAVCALPQFSFAAANDRWRVFDVTTKVEVLKPAGATLIIRKILAAHGVRKAARSPVQLTENMAPNSSLSNGLRR